MIARLLVLGCLIVGGCASYDKGVAAAGINRIAAEELPPPLRSDLSLSTDVYALGAYDEIRLDVFGLEELSNKEMVIDGAGMIAVPLVGPLRAAGKTTGELITEITEGLRRAKVRDPMVTVNLTEGNSNLFTVEGEVEQPGRYPVIGDMTLTRAIASAQGTSELAKVSEVVILRTVGNETFAGLYDLRAIRRGYYQDPAIYVGDVVMVGESRGRRLFRDFLQLAPLLTTPVIVALQR